MKLQFWKKDKPAPENKTEQQTGFNVAKFLNDRNNENVKRRDALLIELLQQTKFLTRQDIQKWRNAWQRAISVDHPSRVELNAIYRDIDIDNHLTGVVGQIKNEVLQKSFKIVDRKTEETELTELKKQLDDAEWFMDFCNLVIDAEFKGLRLVQFGDIVTVNGVKKFDSVEELDEDHVIPEHHVFVKLAGDHYTNGFDYTQPPYNYWCIPVGKPKALGIYNKVAPHAISKKNVLAFWDKFAEIFGMPMRIGKTSSTNPNDRNTITDMLQKMGSAAWGLFPDGTEIEIKETTRGDAYEVYDKRVDRANSEMSKAIVNQTMTTDDGSSKSQSETHLTIQEKVIEYFAKKVRIAVNEKLIPFMIEKHGFTEWADAKYKYDDTVEYTVDEQMKIEEMLLESFDIDPDYFQKKYNVPVVAKKAAPVVPPKGFFD